ncbi:hypothetical protein OIU84_012592 [Salix udensis]|uniref:Uncharacterized protein n=1 Tax=Salix udensis TaxID=889485 RepID=A0AAD6JFX6_9ROSI|nr:hypothetical protein OIU84_012592 [Salix udensis]
MVATPNGAVTKSPKPQPQTLQEEPQQEDETTLASPSIKFGTPEALDHVRNLTDVGAMTRLLHECIAYQRGLDLKPRYSFIPTFRSRQASSSPPKIR